MAFLNKRVEPNQVVVCVGCSIIRLNLAGNVRVTVTTSEIIRSESLKPLHGLPILVLDQLERLPETPGTHAALRTS